MILFFPEPLDMADPGADEPSSRSGSPDPEGRASEDRSLLHQRLAVRELIDTEVSYLHMLQLCASDIRNRLQQVLECGYSQPVFAGANLGLFLRSHVHFWAGLMERKSGGHEV
jgi:hypothetical protein